MSIAMFIGAFGGPELLIILLIAVFLFGADKLPKLARSSGEAMGEFQKGREQIEADIRDSAREAKASGTDDDEDVDVEPGADVDVEPGADEDADATARDVNPA